MELDGRKAPLFLSATAASRDDAAGEGEQEHHSVLGPWIGSCCRHHRRRCIPLLQLEVQEVEEGAGQACQDHAAPARGAHPGRLRRHQEGHQELP